MFKNLRLTTGIAAVLIIFTALLALTGAFLRLSPEGRQKFYQCPPAYPAAAVSWRYGPDAYKNTRYH